jgi:O-methyltransferase domain
VAFPTRLSAGSQTPQGCLRSSAAGEHDDGYVGGKRFSLTPLADPLRQDAPQSSRSQALWSGSEAYRRTWGDLSYSVRTGEPAFDHVYGKPFFDYLAEQPALAKIFNDVMTSASSDEGGAIAAAHDFSGYRRIVDVGGGHGALLAVVLDRYPGPLGVLSDLPEVVETSHGPSTGTTPPVVSKRWQATSLNPCHPAGTPTC